MDNSAAHIFSFVIKKFAGNSLNVQNFDIKFFHPMFFYEKCHCSINASAQFQKFKSQTEGSDNFHLFQL